MPSDAPDGTARAVCSFAGSRAAQEELGVASGGVEWLRRLEQLGLEGTPESYPMLTSWAADPWARHAYPYRPVGWTSEMADALREPHGRLVFAGDYAAPGETSGMEGALRSGVRAAGEVLEMMGAP
jgi:monoamine oxidase